MSELSANPADRASGEDSHRTKGLLRLTMACNERCPFCNVPQEAYQRLTPPWEETLAELEEFVASGAQTLTVSGGEPTLLRKRLVQVVQLARERGLPFVELQTNAVLITPAYAQELADAGLTSAFVSFLSHEPEHHDALAGLPGAFASCLSGIDALLDVGVRVTLNPVTARRTQGLVAAYVDFVAERLPRVRFISMSAVQPHGRADGQAEELLPDYAVLGQSLREARVRAAHHGIELINPYCGLPACVGWDDDPEHCVEAIEALGGGWKRTPGLNNEGNKAHGPACTRCALRTRCGGAWHAYWEVRRGAGIAPPVQLGTPWGRPVEGEQVLFAPGGVTVAQWKALESAPGPTTWVWTDHLGPGDAGRLVRSRVTDVAFETSSLDPDALREPLTVLRRVVSAGRQELPQLRLRTWIALRVDAATNPTAVVRFGSLIGRVRLDGLRILSDGPVWRAIADALRREHPHLDVEAIEPPLMPLGSE